MDKTFAVCTIDDQWPELLCHWLKHYSQMGADHLAIQVVQPACPAMQETLDQCAKRWKFDQIDSDSDFAQLGAEPGDWGDWILHAPLTDLYEFPAPLTRIIADAKRKGISAIFGQRMDQVAADGTQPRVLTDISIWKQFPVACRVRRKFNPQLLDQLMLARFEADPDARQPRHYSAKPKPVPLGRPEQYLVHSFRWFGDAMAKLYGQSSSDERTAKLFWWLETHSGRFDLADPALEAWGADVGWALPTNSSKGERCPPYIGDKIVLLHCHLSVRDELRSIGLQGDAAVASDGVDVFLHQCGSRIDEQKIKAWISRLHTEAAMAGNIAAIWMPQMPAELKNAIAIAAGADLLEIDPSSAANAMEQLQALALPPPPTKAQTFVVCSIRNGGAELLPHWLEHYTRLGVDHLILAVGEPTEPDVEAMLAQCARRWKFIRYNVPHNSTVGDNNDELHRTAFRSAGARHDSWVLHTDLDELHEFPLSLPALIAAAEAQNLAAIFGHFVDRVAADGTLPFIQPSPSLWDQFPIGCRLTRKIAGGFTQKLMLARFWVRTTTGHHAASNALPGAIPFGSLDDYRVHHFKWHGQVVSRLQWGLAQPIVAQCWKKEARILLNWFNANGGRINIHDPKLAAAAQRPDWDKIESMHSTAAILTAAAGKTFAVCTLHEGQEDFLPHWLEHYSKLGVERLVVAVPRQANPQIQQIIEECATQWSFEQFAGSSMEALQVAGAANRDWIIHAEADELHEFPAPLNWIISSSDSLGIPAIFGVVIDHLTMDGCLPPTVRASPSAWEQFPLGCNFTARIADVRRQLMLARFDSKDLAPKTPGNEDSADDPLPVGCAQQYLIHRFSWTLGSVARLRLLLANSDTDGASKARTLRLLTYLDANCGKMNLNDTALDFREEWHPSRLEAIQTPRIPLPYIGGRLVLLQCSQAICRELQFHGIHCAMCHQGTDVRRWLEQLCNQAAMTGAICAVWMPGIAKELAGAVRRAAEDFLEISAETVEQVIQQLAAHAVPLPNSADKIWAICSIANGAADLLPHWLEHYSALEVDRLLIAVADPAESATESIIQRCAQRWQFERLHVPARLCLGDENCQTHRTLARLAGALPSTWILPTNLDEFYEFPAPLKQVIAAAQSQGAKSIFGQLLDRVATEGLLPPIRSDNLSGQFPMGCRLTETIARTSVPRLMAVRFNVRAELARFSATNAGPGSVPIGRPSEYVVHHFKWHAQLRGRLECGLLQPSSDAAWKERAKQTLVWLRLNQGRINLNLPTLKAKPHVAPLRLAS